MKNRMFVHTDGSTHPVTATSMERFLENRNPDDWSYMDWDETMWCHISRRINRAITGRNWPICAEVCHQWLMATSGTVKDKFWHRTMRCLDRLWLLGHPGCTQHCIISHENHRPFVKYLYGGTNA